MTWTIIVCILGITLTYRFDVFDPRYDILASGLSKGEYAELFTEQMLRSRAAIPLRRWLTRYQALTGAEYIEYFNERHWHTLRSFALLVERKEIDLWQFFEQHKEDGTRAHPLELLQEYALKISSWRCYRFAKRLFSQYTFSQLQGIFGNGFYFHKGFIREEGYYSRKSYRLSMARPFLTAEQHRGIYDWIDASFFQISARPPTAIAAARPASLTSCAPTMRVATLETEGRMTVERISNDYTENVRWFDDVLGVNRSCDIVSRDPVRNIEGVYPNGRAISYSLIR